MQRRFFLYVVVSQCPAIFKLLASKNQSLLIRRYTFFVLSRSTCFVYDFTPTLCPVSSLYNCSDMRCTFQAGITTLYLNFGLDIIDGITAFHLKSNGLACQGLHKYLHCFKCCLPTGLALGSQMLLAWPPETLLGPVSAPSQRIRLISRDCVFRCQSPDRPAAGGTASVSCSSDCK